MHRAKALTPQLTGVRFPYLVNHAASSVSSSGRDARAAATLARGLVYQAVVGYELVSEAAFFVQCFILLASRSSLPQPPAVIIYSHARTIPDRNH